MSKFWHVRNPLPQKIQLRLIVLVRYRGCQGRLGRVKFVLNVLRWKKLNQRTHDSHTLDISSLDVGYLIFTGCFPQTMNNNCQKIDVILRNVEVRGSLRFGGGWPSSSVVKPKQRSTLNFGSVGLPRLGPNIAYVWTYVSTYTVTQMNRQTDIEPSKVYSFWLWRIHGFH